MNRRRGALVAGVAAVAAAAGAGFAGWRSRAGEPGETGSEAGLQALWALKLARPEGGEVTLASFRGKPLVLNFWATWCEPCVREMPALDRFHREFQPRGWQVLGLAIDGPTPVREFLAKRPVGFAIGLAGLDGTDLLRPLGNTRGGLPFTLVLDAGGRVLHRQLGESSHDQLVKWASAAG